MTRINGDQFITEVQHHFDFLANFGFALTRAEPDPTGYRFADIVEYESESLRLCVGRENRTREITSDIELKMGMGKKLGLNIIDLSSLLNERHLQQFQLHRKSW